MKTTRTTILLLIAFLISPGSKAQETNSEKYVGFDINPLMAQILPFNRVSLNEHTFAITTRRYWGRNGLRAAYGVGLGDALDVNFLQFSFGYDYRIPLSKNWYYFSGVEMVLKIADDINSNNPVNGNAQGFGLGGHWGAEYRFGSVVSLSAEATLRFLVNPDEGGTLILNPPFNLTAHFNISKK